MRSMFAERLSTFVSLWFLARCLFGIARTRMYEVDFQQFDCPRLTGDALLAGLIVLSSVQVCIGSWFSDVENML